LILNKKRFILFFLCLALISSLGAQEKASSLHAKCLSCHKIESVCEVKHKIDESQFFASVHAGLDCTECHWVNQSETDKNIPHKKDLPEVNCIARCHQEDQKTQPGSSPLHYPDSVHGKAYLERKIQDVPRCWDCHGKHNIKKPSNLESTVNRKNLPLTCSVCHEDMNVIVKYNIHCEKPYQEYMNSVHGKALYRKGLLLFAAVCTDCHGIHDIKGVGEPNLMAKRPETCGKCHILIFDEYRESVHGQEALKGNIDTALCVDCHGEHQIISPLNREAPTSLKNISHTCAGCHSRPEIMQKYGVPEDRVESFIQSLHGIATEYGDKATAKCTSCHGIHDIRPAENPFSRVNPANLAQTCGQEKCHPGISEKIANAKIHLDINQKKSGPPYYVQRVFLWIVILAVLFTILWFVPGFIKKIKLLKNKKGPKK